MGKKKEVLMLVVVFSMFILPINLASSEEFGYNLLEAGKNLNPTINITSLNVNSSQYWDTGDRGPLRNVADILHNWLDATSLLWSNAGHNIDTTIEMNANPINNVSHVQFDPAGNGCTDEFCLEVDSTMDKLVYTLPGGNVVNSIGFETYFGDGRVRNTESFTIDNCKVVYQSGATGAIAEIKIAGVEKGYRIAQATVGLTTESITANQLGYVTSQGIVRDCNTSGFSGGDGLYLSTNGTITNIPPTGNGTIFIGTVNRVHATEGEINVILEKIPSIGDVLYSRNNADGLQIKNISNGTANGDAVNKGQMETSDAFKLNKNGSNADETINIGSQTLTTTGTLTAEHLYSTDDGQIDGDLTLGTFGQTSKLKIFTHGIVDAINITGSTGNSYTFENRNSGYLKLKYNGDVRTIWTPNGIMMGRGINSTYLPSYPLQLVDTGVNPFLLENINPTSGSTMRIKNTNYGAYIGMSGQGDIVLTNDDANPTDAILKLDRDAPYDSVFVDGSGIGEFREGISAHGDNVYIYSGVSRDAGFYYDGTDWIFNPKLTGSGFMKILGDFWVNEDLTVVGDINQTNGNATINNIYGEVWGQHIGSINVVSSNVYYNVSNTTAGLNNGFLFNQTGSGDLTAEYDGVYKVVTQWSFSDGANTEFHISLSINNVQQDKCHAERKLGTGGDVGSASYTCLIQLNDGDFIIPIIENADNTNNPQVHDIQLNILRIGN